LPKRGRDVSLGRWSAFGVQRESVRHSRISTGVDAATAIFTDSDLPTTSWCWTASVYVCYIFSWWNPVSESACGWNISCFIRYA